MDPKLAENNKDMLFHQFGARMNSHRRNSTKVLRRSRKDTAPGPDRIQFWDIKNLTEEDWAELYTIYQESFDKGYIPKDWTDSFLRPIPKPRKDHHKLTGYRMLTVWRHKTFFIHFSWASAVDTLAVPYLHN